MIDVGFIGDLHFGHAAIAKLRGFDDIDAYNEHIITQYNSVLHKKSLVFLIGDITMEKTTYYPLLDRLLGRKALIGGNHDMRNHTKEILEYIDSISGCVEYKGCIITHIPIHTQEVSRFRLNIHAHLHEKIIEHIQYMPMQIQARITEDPRYFCASWDRLNGVPVSLEQILATKQ